jgi:hypothetical protein
VKYEFFSTDYPSLLQELELFLGPTAIDHKLKKLDRALKLRNPLVAAYYGTMPKASLWLGIGKARGGFKKVSGISIADEDVHRALDLGL